MRYIFILLLFFSCQLLSSQSKASFSLHQQFYVYGDAMVIGNNILSKHKTRSFNKYNTINDQVKMKYIDIDKDNNTFSSSQATLNLPKKTKKIISATLYWSAIYSFTKGKKKKRGNNIVYKGNNERDSIINKIKFKTPNNDYQNIEGTIILDKFKQSEYKDNAPYVCYADVTDIVNKNQNQNGAYTVANVKATKGYTTGGSAGGWLLYVVFESQTDKPKYISTYHGLATVQKEPLDINLKDFKTITNGKSKASLTLSALEGDTSLGRDQCLIYNKNKEAFIPLESKLRSKKNFFNSSITINNKNFIDRVPGSINTLGFDIVEMELPNKNNELIPNGTTSITIRLKTKSDRFHLFFTAFKTELEDDYFRKKKEELALQKRKINGELKEVNTLETIKKNINIDGLEPGYYIISNVFSNQNLSKKWETFLKNKSHRPKSFFNEKNKWHYISIYNSLDENKARLNLKKYKKLNYFEGLWLQKINL